LNWFLLVVDMLCPKTSLRVCQAQRAKILLSNRHVVSVSFRRRFVCKVLLCARGVGEFWISTRADTACAKLHNVIIALIHQSVNKDPM
jgi:glycyl-tRNA synthetase alpha subunit